MYRPTLLFFVSLFLFCSEKRQAPEPQISPTEMLLFMAESFKDINPLRPPGDVTEEMNKFENYLTKGAKIDSADNKDRTALILLSNTAEANYFSTVTALAKILLENKTDVRITDYYKRTALHYASVNGNKSLVELLVNNGADVNALDESKVNSVAAAVLGGDHVEVVDFLIEHGAELTWREPKMGSDDSLTLLDIAKMRNYTKTAALLESKMGK